ncbi:single-stranded DNA-binding protein [Clostridium tepidum]|uniref:Single-stranded DNA-binding protein n=1 Tax=Clostridium tepidum TaxID=1962263 RepID=A0A1S9IGH6_9CLOT|nr:single-stranded DNA-binding protein [Clostridium tepidum]MCR1934940.1 single-stranded DNA-binding protein [Clostridium tepidum]MDU6878986.1 single-stranded DNA-binding protein [Clostridium botulinum]OOO61810.1 single-stranded DNA-binding protein [Clostridium tepidum]OOO69430.1 single-stranded DNA-binding protein [Clostridium tepidum]
MNKVVLIGRLTKDPELRFTPGNGTAVATFTLAVDRRFSKDGQREADFIPIVVWGKQAESTANYMSKGKLMGVSGRIQTRSYEAKDGTRRYVTEVIAEEVKFLEWGNKPTTDSTYNNGSEPSYQSNQGFGNDNSFDDDIIPVDDGDIPF